VNDDIDPRWNLLRGREWQCELCDELHRGIFDLACRSPESWDGPGDYAPNSVVAPSTNCLTEDFCILNGEYYFIRCVLRLPLIGAPGGFFAFSTWSTLSKKNFTIYRDHFDSGKGEDCGPWFGWFSNRLERCRRAIRMWHPYIDGNGSNPRATVVARTDRRGAGCGDG
jgi:hypothetical protein